MPIDAVMHFKMKSREGALFPSIEQKALPCCGHVTAGLLVARSGLFRIRLSRLWHLADIDITPSKSNVRFWG